MSSFNKAILYVTGALLAIGLLLYLLVFDVWTVPADDPVLAASIEPALAPGDVILLSRLSTAAPPHLLRCSDPDEPGRFVVGRAVGKTNDHVEITGDAVFVNGLRKPSPRSCTPSSVLVRRPNTDEDIRLTCSEEELLDTTYRALHRNESPLPPIAAEVPGGKLYLVSDNRHLHLDSRDYGSVDPANCSAISYRLWGVGGITDPLRRFTIIW